jgi:flagellin
MFASRKLGENGLTLKKSMEKLSSGESINRAGDNASGLAVSEKMRSQIRGLNQASRNTRDGISMLQVAEGYMQETTGILQRIRELAVQSANGVYSDEDRSYIQVEVSQLVSEIDRISSSAQFNGMNLLTGRYSEDGILLHVGANMDQEFSVKLGNVSATALNLKNEQDAISIATAEEANATIGTIDEALKTVLKNRADIGAAQNRLEASDRCINVAAENLQASESVIRDTDIAKQMVEYTRDQILMQSGVAMLAQSQIDSNMVLKILD